MYRSAAAIAYPTAQTPPGMPGRKLTHLASDLLPLGDFFYLLLAGLFSSYVMTHWLAPLGFAVRIGEEFHRAGLVVAVLAPFMLYDKRFGPAASHGRMVELVRSHALRFSVFAGVVLLLGGLIHARDAVPYAWLAVWLSASLLLTSLGRVVVAQYLRHLQRRGRLSELIAVVGDGPVADRLVQALRQARPASIELLGVFDDAAAEPPEGTLESAASLTHLIELGKHRRIDWILLALPPTAEQRILSVVQRLKALSVPIGLCPQHVGLSVPCHAIDYVADSLPVSLLADHPIKRWNLVAKRSEDFLIGVVVTALLAPVLACIALAIKLDSPGPVIFRQRRHAFNNREFDIYKFRTMSWNPDAATERLVQTARGDQRVTRVGRLLRSTSLDELPQLFNVLKGDMSLVGPRPHALSMRTENRLGSEITQAYAHRHRVKPGITGWSQINGSRGATDTVAQLRRRVKLDLFYIRHWSLLLDLRILLLTSREVFRTTNAY
jgi:Undecaprenyl-phosphate glucose phosphotransferase